MRYIANAGFFEFLVVSNSSGYSNESYFTNEVDITKLLQFESFNRFSTGKTEKLDF